MTIFFRSSGLILLIIMSHMAIASGDCTDDLESENFIKAMEEANDADASEFPQRCEDAGGDIFAYSGKVTCDGSVFTYNYKPECFPNSCTENKTTTTVTSTIVDKIEESGERDCEGREFEFEALGVGIPSIYQCAEDSSPKNTPSEHSEFMTKLGEELLEDEPDFSGLVQLCEDLDGYDYFQYSATRQCEGGPEEEISGRPDCRPFSCTFNEAVLKRIIYSADECINLPSLSFSNLVETPSFSPSTLPTTSPTTFPTSNPSFSPSNSPSTSYPSRSPSTYPSRSPSTYPSSRPSTYPTAQPSSRPSTYPTAQPSVLPSTAPSCNPSTAPSSSPTPKPTKKCKTRDICKTTHKCYDEQKCRYLDNPSIAPSSPPTATPFTRCAEEKPDPSKSNLSPNSGYNRNGILPLLMLIIGSGILL